MITHPFFVIGCAIETDSLGLSRWRAAYQMQCTLRIADFHVEFVALDKVDLYLSFMPT